MRKALDRVYLGAGWLAAALILGISLLVSTQVLLNLATRLFDVPLPSTIPSYADFSGYMLAAATFLAMPYTFRSGGHIRVSLFIARLPPAAQRHLEVLVLAAAAGLVGFALWYMVRLTAESIEYGDVSYGIVPVPLWIPQSVMTAGMALLFLAVLDTLVEAVRRPSQTAVGIEDA